MGKEGAVIWDFDVHLRLECPLLFQPSPKAKSAAACFGFFLSISPAWLNLPDESYCLGGAGLPVGGGMFNICCKELCFPGQGMLRVQGVLRVQHPEPKHLVRMLHTQKRLAGGLMVWGGLAPVF